jgi:hypothetical protein
MALFVFLLEGWCALLLGCAASAAIQALDAWRNWCESAAATSVV